MKRKKDANPTVPLSFFTEDQRVKKEIDEILLPFLDEQRRRNPGFGYSDVQDNAGHFYVDLVQEGGGVLGIALVGYTYALEKAGIRFLKMAGTSAGAINTMLLAAADKPAEAKSEKILKAIAELDLLSFVDGDSDVQDFFQALIAKRGKAVMAWKGIQVIDDLKGSLGLNPGEVFYQWLSDVIESYGIRTVMDLRARMEDLPEELKEVVYPAAMAEARKDDWPLALISADITTESKAVLPKHGPLYFAEPEQVHPAYYVRASMAVPLFFHPLHRDPGHFREDRPYLGQPMPRQHNFWTSELHYAGEIPEKIMFVDGGILSNFPIDIFHAWDRVPRRPTFGVKLGLSRSQYNKVEDMSALGLIGAAFNAARNMRDEEFIFNNPELDQLVTQIDTGDHNWLNFALSPEEKLDLFYRGVQAGVNFLTHFDWEAYKEERQRKLLSLVDRLSHDLTMLEKAEDQRAPRTRSRSVQADPEAEAAAAAAQKALRERLSMLTVMCEKFNILWIYDDYHKYNPDLPEINFIKSLCVNYEIQCLTTAAAEALLTSDSSKKFDLVISAVEWKDIQSAMSSAEDPSAINWADVRSPALHFPKKMRIILGPDQAPPTIFYCSHHDPSLGTPPFAFGMTDSPTELIHLIIDVLQRKTSGSKQKGRSRHY